ncbi:unnamed protein product [Ceutorhynchus assimilis]|uniref:Sulfatase N-terminal domain-containing protein n=1 Tax=Ceutorhynchus assimilis TaxID=467358 RepID=A0A9N9MJ97_9CUCU|nr:unnamed protein product [Ceutorhynchus assimilis]
MTIIYLLALLLIFSNGINGINGNRKKPNIIMILADDLGFNDVSFHGSDEIATPNIDALAYNGVILNNHYTQAMCTPSRAALLTGKYPIRLGMQHLVILEPEPSGLPLNETLLPQYLKKQGYVTRAVGKWHLGFFKNEYTPVYRGFDSHYGYYQGFIDYYDHINKASQTGEYGYDFHRNLTVDWDAKGKYTTTLLTEEAVKLIEQHNTENPMFLYLSHLAPHAGNDWNPLEAPDEEIAKFAHIRDPERRIYAAIVSLLDKSVGEVVKALRNRDMLENSIIVFISDNGAPTDGQHANHGSNYPLRGIKQTVFEGAHRNVAVMWSPLIKNLKRVSNNLMHITDWLPTLISAAGLDTKLPSNLDGLDQWKSISEGQESPRSEILYNIDEVFNFGAYRQGIWKYLYGTTFNGEHDQWYGSIGKDPTYKYNLDKVLESPVAVALTALATYKQIQDKNNLTVLNTIDIQRLRSEATITCNKSKIIKCQPQIKPCLFNLADDPCEMLNLASQRPFILKNLQLEIEKFKKSARTPINKPRDINADPAKHNGTWIPWQSIPENYGKKELSKMGLFAGMGFVVVLIGLVVLGLNKLKLSRVYEPAPRKNEEIESS